MIKTQTRPEILIPSRTIYTQDREEDKTYLDLLSLSNEGRIKLDQEIPSTSLCVLLRSSKKTRPIQDILERQNLTRYHKQIASYVLSSPVQQVDREFNDEFQRNIFERFLETNDYSFYLLWNNPVMIHKVKDFAERRR